VRALLATVQWRSAFRAIPGEVGTVGKHGRATEATRRGDGLHEAWKPWAGYIDGGTQALPGPVVAIALGPVVRAVCVHVAPLFILAITVHGELWLLLEAARKSF